MLIVLELLFPKIWEYLWAHFIFTGLYVSLLHNLLINIFVLLLQLLASVLPYHDQYNCSIDYLAAENERRVRLVWLLLGNWIPGQISQGYRSCRRGPSWNNDGWWWGQVMPSRRWLTETTVDHHFTKYGSGMLQWLWWRISSLVLSAESLVVLHMYSMLKGTLLTVILLGISSGVNIWQCKLHISAVNWH